MYKYGTVILNTFLTEYKILYVDQTQSWFQELRIRHALSLDINLFFWGHFNE